VCDCWQCNATEDDWWAWIEAKCGEGGHAAHWPGGSCYCGINLGQGWIGATLLKHPDMTIPTDPYMLVGELLFEGQRKWYGVEQGVQGL
jgi:hypothetical protein